MIDSNGFIKLEHLLLTDRLTRKVLDLALDDEEPIFKMVEMLPSVLAIVVVVFLSISRENGINMKKIRELMNKS